MAELPTGTVTFLFTDIEGSTKLLQRLGPTGYAEALAAHQRLLRQAAADHAGVEVDTQGDSFFVAFPRATDALAAAAEATRALAAYPWPPNGMVRVRMGLHTGTPHLSKDGLRYVGIDVNRAARIAAAGHGGQILLSQTTRDQVAKELVAGEGIRDLGKHRLKDLPRREELYQLVLSGLPADYPPLKTLDAWPGLRADFTVVVLISAVLLAAAGLALPVVVPAFPRWIGWAAGGLAALLIVADVVAKPVRRLLASQWRDARKPFAAITSTLLSLVVITTTLFITKPPIIIKPTHVGYDFPYTYHAPAKTGGTVAIGIHGSLASLAAGFGPSSSINDVGLWQSCVTQLPDTTLGLKGWRADQCSDIPTNANEEESVDDKTTTFHIDPKAVWSDGVPITADDFVFTFLLDTDPNMGLALRANGKATAVDSHTVHIDWATPNLLYLLDLEVLAPLPLHVLATGAFAGVYDPTTGAYDSALAQQLVASAPFNTAIAVDNGPFTVAHFDPASPTFGGHAILVKNAHFFSNFFHAPALDSVTLTADNWIPNNDPQAPPESQALETLFTAYEQGTLDMVDDFGPASLSRLSSVPKSQVVISPFPTWLELAFNQRAEAPNAQANGGVSIFTDRNVRQAFVEAFDRCAAVRAQLAVSTCDPNLLTDEFTVPPGADYDPSVKLPSYNPVDAARLMDAAGYRVVGGIRRAKDGTTPLQLTIHNSSGGARDPIIAQRLLQDYTRNLQIDVGIAPTPDLFSAQVARQGTFDIALYEEGGFLDPLVNARDVAILFAGNAADIPSTTNPDGRNFFGIVDPKLVQQAQLGQQIPDGDQRANVFRELQRYLVPQVYAEPVLIQANVVLAKPTICNFKKSGVPPGNLWNMADWYVAPSCPT